MKERGKAVETYSGVDRDAFSDYNYSAPDAPCEKHPTPYPIGVCPHCLKERLIKLVCSDCGEQRLSSCSCSEVSSSSNRNSSATEAASVGRISFLIENERAESKQSKIKATKKNGAESEEFVILKRSNSSCVVGAKRRTSGFWRVVRLFKKKRERASERVDGAGGGGGGGDDQKSDLWVFDYMGVSRSRSLCSFRGGGGACNSYDPDEGSSEFAFSSAKISDFNGRSSIESSRMSGFSEAEPSKSGIRVLSDSETTGGGGGGGVIKRFGGLKESDFTKQMDESSFIDLKLDSLSESKPEFSVPELIRMRNGDHFLGSHESLRRGGSCRVPKLDETTRIGKDRRGHKVWRWIIRHHPNWGIASKKNDHD